MITLEIDGIVRKIYVPDNTMRFSMVVGRDILKRFNFKLVTVPNTDDEAQTIQEILSVDIIFVKFQMNQLIV